MNENQFMMNPSVNYKGKPVNYRDEGNGPVVVLLHGFLESLEVWNDFAGELSQQFRVVRVDVPGHGQTPVTQNDASLKNMADAVKAVLDALDVETCVMIGHSMGGYITLEFAKHYGKMLRGFGLFHSHASPDTEETRENRRRTINIVKLNRAGFIKQFIPDLFAEANVAKYGKEIQRLQEMAEKTSAEGIIAALNAMKDRSGKIELLLNTRLPVLFIAGKEDSRIPVQNVMAQAILPSHAEVLILGNVAHMGFIEARTQTLEVIRSFATRIFKS